MLIFDVMTQFHSYLINKILLCYKIYLALQIMKPKP